MLPGATPYERDTTCKAVAVSMGIKVISSKAAKSQRFIVLMIKQNEAPERNVYHKDKEPPIRRLFI
jgi:hypothetical protein